MAADAGMRRCVVRVSVLILAALVCFAPASPRAQLVRGAPETFSADAQVKTAKASATAAITIHVQRYTPDFDRKSVETGLKSAGYNGFLTALRKAPSVGFVEIGGEKHLIRYARERANAKGRDIVLVTEKPVFFIGGGATKAKARDVYQVAVIQMQVDDAGAGSGTLAAAARVRPGGETGVQLDDYAEEPIKLVGVKRTGS
jgi:hypothetical protein